MFDDELYDDRDDDDFGRDWEEDDEEDEDNWGLNPYERAEFINDGKAGRMF